MIRMCVMFLVGCALVYSGFDVAREASSQVWIDSSMIAVGRLISFVGGALMFFPFLFTALNKKQREDEERASKRPNNGKKKAAERESSQCAAPAVAEVAAPDAPAIEEPPKASSVADVHERVANEAQPLDDDEFSFY